MQILALTPVSDPQHAGQTNAEHTVKHLLCQLRLVPLVYGASSCTANQLLVRQRRPHTMGLVSLQLVKFGPHMG